MSKEIIIKAQPSVDPTVCNFKIEELFVGRTIHCQKKESARDPFVIALMDIEGIKEVFINDKMVTISKGSSSKSWNELGSEIGRVIRLQLQSDGELFLDDEIEKDNAGHCSHCHCHESTDNPLEDQELLTAVKSILDSDINPQVAHHGGHIEVVKVEAGRVYVRMEGGCQGCSMSQETLRGGVERHLRNTLPQIKSVTDVTHHQEGINPFYK